MSAYAQAQENLALNKTITASSEWARPANYGPDKAVDGDNKTRWSAIKGAAESWLQIDFGEKTKFSKVVVNGDYADRVAKYSIEVSDDGEKWKPVVKEVERECNQSKSSVWEATFKSVKNAMCACSFTLLSVTEIPAKLPFANLKYINLPT